jgi:hypothetical protein
MLELAISLTDYEKRGLVQSAIFKAGKNIVTKSGLLKELNLLENQYYTAKINNYYLVTSISINRHRRKLSNRRIGDVYISFPGKFPKIFSKKKNRCNSFDSFLDKTQYPIDYMLAMVKVKAKSTHQAAINALIGLNLYRSYLNFSNNLHHPYSFFLGSKRIPINEILLGPLHSLYNENGDLVPDEFWYEEDYRGPCKTFDPPVVGEYEKKINLAHEFIGKSKKLRYMESVEEALLRYNDALDCYDWNVAFIKLWSVLELLTNTLNESYKTTIRRAAFIYKDYEIVKQSLEMLKDYRNNVIHKGVAAGDIQVFIYDLKGYVEQLLLFLINNKYVFFNFEEAAEFFDQHRDIVVLNRKFRMMKNAKKFFNV